MKVFRLPDETHLRRVHLRTANLARAIDFYQRVIGLTVFDRGEWGVWLSASRRGPALLILTDDQTAAPRTARATGLYHFAIRFPTRRDLAHVALRIVAAEYESDGGSDHGIGESIHLTDPDGNGVELYVDRPRAEWPMRNGRIELITRPLNLLSLLATADDELVPKHAAAGTDIGHINLHVVDLKEAERFFHDFLGLSVTARIGRSATFLAAGDYHHHVAVNTWAGKNRPTANSVGLISYRLAVPDAHVFSELTERARSFGYEAQSADDLLQVRDPNGDWLELEFASSTRPQITETLAVASKA